MYRFLLRPRWLGGLALAIAAAVAMVFLGIWQWHRYEERTAINNRIDAADTVSALPLTSVLPTPTTPGAAGRAPGDDRSWTKVTVSGRYDPAHEIQARGRTVNGDVGFEIVTPLILSDGSAVLVDRGWVPQGGDALAAPKFPPAPTGTVTVVGQIHLSESRPTAVQHRDGRLDTRRISVPRLAGSMPYPVYGAYVLLTAQTPPASPQFTPIPIDHEDAWQNAGYTVQWWLFAGMALFAFGWQARKEALGENPPPQSSRQPVPAGAAPDVAADRAVVMDRVPESDRRGTAEPVLDRVAESDRRRGAAQPVPEPVAALPGLDPVAAQPDPAATAAQPSSGQPGSAAGQPDRGAAQPGLDRVAESDRRNAVRADAEPPPTRRARADRRAAKRAARTEPQLDRVAESDRRAAERAAQSARRPD